MNKMFIKQILMHSLLPTSPLSQHLSRCVHLSHYSSKYTSRLHPFSCNESRFPAEYDGLLGIKCMAAFAYVISIYAQYYGKSQLCLWAFHVKKLFKSSHQDLNWKGNFSLHQNSCFFPFFFTGHAPFGQPWPWSTTEQKQCKEMCKPAL